ncbi:MAG: ATP-binding protein [Nitrospinales bacterium]
MKRNKMSNPSENDIPINESSSLKEPQGQDQVLEILKLESLKRVDLFKEFSESALRLLAKDCKNRLLKKGELLCTEGAMESAMYIILSGDLEIRKMQKKVDILGAGQYLGEMALIDSKPRSATVIARNDSLVMEIDAEVFAKHIVNEPAHSYSMIRTLSNRTRNLLDIISEDCQKLNCFVHDMRNVLSAIDLPELYLNALIKRLENTDNSEDKNDLKNIDKSLKKITSVRNNLQTLIDQSLMVAKNATAEYVKENKSILPLIDEIIEELSCHTSLKYKTIKVSSQGSIGKTAFNSLDIKRVLQNLIVNAGYVSKKNQIIEIIICNTKENIQVSVADSGCGIPDDVKPFLLKTRYTTKPNGNGFGLLSCRNIIEDHHQGRFWFDSKIDKGTTFHFTLPK